MLTTSDNAAKISVSVLSAKLLGKKMYLTEKERSLPPSSLTVLTDKLVDIPRFVRNSTKPVEKVAVYLQ